MMTKQTLLNTFRMCYRRLSICLNDPSRNKKEQCLVPLFSPIKILSVFILVLVANIAAFSQSYLLNASANGTTVNTCGGTFYDSGGGSSRYAKNKDFTMTFCSDNGMGLHVNFSVFKVKDNGFLYVHDGNSTAATQIAGSPFSKDDVPGFISSSGTCLTFRFVSGSDDEDGWEAAFFCDQSNNCAGGSDDWETNGSQSVPSGSYIINMGVSPQTIENGLLPYGLVWELLNDHRVPIIWSINGSKEKDGVDFYYNGVPFSGGPFIISAEHRTAAVNATIAAWEAQGVVGVNTFTPVTVPVNRELNYAMHWTLDEQNGGIAEKFLQNANIPESGYDWVLPNELSCCNDIFVMPHADPVWGTHAQLLSWNDCEANGGCRGAIWAGCKAVSELENIKNPYLPTQSLNFLMEDPISPVTNPAVWSGDHEDGTGSYEYGFPTHPVMQFVGILDGAQEGGAEQVYLPTNSWRSSTMVGIWDANHSDLGSLSNGPAAKLAFGPAFGNTERGYVAYESSHDIAKEDSPENVAAQRAFFNFSFMALGEKAIEPFVVVPSIMETGGVYALNASATGGSGNYNFSWSSTCSGGSFTNANSANATFTAPNVLTPTTCQIRLEVTDECGIRTSFEVVEITVVPEEICDNGIDDDLDGLIDCLDPDCDKTTVSITGSAAVCSGSSVLMTAKATGGTGPYSFSWSHGLGNGNTKNVTPLSSTTYTVTVTNGEGCTAEGVTTVPILPNPLVNAGENETICRFKNTTIQAVASEAPGPFDFVWDHGLGSGDSHTVSPLETTTYSVTVTSDNGCVSTDQVTIGVQTCQEICENGLDDDGDGFIDCDDTDCGPTVEMGPDISTCAGENNTIEAVASGGLGQLTIEWSHGLGSGSSKVVAPVATTVYSVTVSAPSGCSVIDELTVVVEPCGEDCYNGLDDDGDGLIDCDDPDCQAVSAPKLNDDNYTSCPALPFTDRVTYNDENLQDPSFSIFAQPTQGMVSIDETGKFTYFPFTTECQTDVFVYEVCNQISGCCSTASVTIDLGDYTAPVLTNVPADITIGCDDQVPDPISVIAFDECPGLYIDFEENQAPLSGSSCDSYIITRTWTAMDLCGNTAQQSQTITVMDQTKPEIFQVYTMENGARVVAGVAQRVTHDWKYIPFPITFDGTPMVFSTVATNNENTPVTTRQRNPYSQGFELRLIEEERSDGKHLPETVAWIAVEEGVNLGEFNMEVGRWENINETTTTQTFSDLFGDQPGLLTTIQSNNDADPVNVRTAQVTNTSVDLFLQEETSEDAEVSHGYEHVGYLAFTPGAEWKDASGVGFGETGRLDVSNAWTSISLGRSYTKPVVVLSISSQNDEDAVNVRVRNLTHNSFDVSLQGWDYLIQNHPPEAVSWMVIEGSIPGNQGYFCSGSRSDLQVGKNVFAVDNCDNKVTFEYEETPVVTNAGTQTTRTWSATDDCGNAALLTRYDTCSTAALSLKASLFGAHINTVGGLMRDDLRKQNIVPAWEPYSKLSAFGHVKDHSVNGNGPQANPNADRIPVCHKAGTVAEKTLYLPQSAVDAHLAHGDYEGVCTSNTDPFALSPGAFSAEFHTVADGNWNDASTWQNGNIPPTNNNTNTTISIEHNVTLQSGGLRLGSGSELWVNNGGLNIQSGDLELQSGASSYLFYTVLLLNDGDLLVGHSSAIFEATGSQLSINGNVANTGAMLLQGVCTDVLGSLENSSSLEMMHTRLKTGEYLQNFSSGNIHVFDVKIDVGFGDFQNLGLASIEGEGLVIRAQSGGIVNLANWSATIDQYCVSSFATGLFGLLPLSEDCAGVEDFFTNCGEVVSMYTPEEPNNNGGVGSQILTSEQISGPGSIDPTLLEDEGDNAIVDWMLLEIRDPLLGDEIVDYATVVLQRDGDVVSEDGDPLINFSDLLEGEYHVALRHRNHIGVMTDAPIYLTTDNPPFLDFTNPNFSLRGGETSLKNGGGFKSMWAGDFNMDDKIIFQGPYNDIFYLFGRVLSDEGNASYLANYIVNDYDENDLNLDGKVIFQGPGNDRAYVLYHSILSHPGNIAFLANYIINGPLP